MSFHQLLTCIGHVFSGEENSYSSSAISSYNTLNSGVEDGHVDKEAKSRR